jgi:hypothetical protein
MIACATQSVTTSASVRLTPGVLGLLRQEIVSRHVNGNEQQVEVGVHRGPLGSALCLSTADFDPAAQKSSITTGLAMESII